MDCPPKRAQLKAPGGRDLDSGSDNVTGEQWTGGHCGHSTVFAYCQPQNLAQIWTFYRYTLTIIWLLHLWNNVSFHCPFLWFIRIFTCSFVPSPLTVSMFSLMAQVLVPTGHSLFATPLTLHLMLPATEKKDIAKICCAERAIESFNQSTFYKIGVYKYLID